jgi:DNA polymerase-3 subunit gamma/tau
LRVLAQAVEMDEQRLTHLLPQANNLRPREVVYLIERLGEAQREIRDGLDPRLQLELALVKTTRPQLDHSEIALEERLRRLETMAAASGVRPMIADEQAHTGLAGGSTPPPAPALERATVDADHDGNEAGEEIDQAGDPGLIAPHDGEGAPSPSADVTLERIRRAWDLILQHVQTSSVSLYAMLREARPSNLDGDTLTVTLPSNLTLTRAREPGNAELLAGATESALGVRLTAVFAPAEGREDALPEASPEPAVASNSEDYNFTEQIRRAQEKLDAELLPDEP